MVTRLCMYTHERAYRKNNKMPMLNNAMIEETFYMYEDKAQV